MSDDKAPPVGQVAYPNPKIPSHLRPSPSREGAQNDAAVPQNDEANSDDESMIESGNPELGGVYAAPMRVLYQNRVENSIIFPLPSRTIGGLRDQVEQTRACHCQKSNCLKLYCECFSSGLHCNAYCSCVDCDNDGSKEHQETRNKAILACLEKNPNTFRSAPLIGSQQLKPGVSEAVARSTTVVKPETGCQCKKARCLKKWCECFRRNEYCNDTCKCYQCKNIAGDPERRQLALPPHKKNSTAAAAVPAKKSKAAESTAPQSSMTLASRDAIPMNLPGDVMSTTLAFGKGVTVKKRKKEASAGGNNSVSAFDRAMATEEAVLARRKATEVGQSTSTQKKKKRRETCAQKELERHWSEEARDVLGTFQAMRQELLQRKQDAGLLSPDIVLSREYSYYDLVGSAQLASVELDLVDVLSSVRDAEGRAQSLVAEDANQQSQKAASRDTSSPQGRDTKAQGLPQSQRAQIISQAVQDTALMRELARIIRGKALEMSEGRKDGFRL